MSNLENLVSKIVADSEREAEAILYEAQTEAQKVMDEQVDQGERESERILAEARMEASRHSEQIIMGKSIAIRDENLAAKQKTLDGIFADVLKKLQEMPEQQFFAFVAAQLDGTEIDGQEIILPKSYKKSLSKLNKYLNGKGYGGSLVHAGDEREISGGFIIKKGGVEVNNTFESLVGYYRYELESDVMKMLY